VRRLPKRAGRLRSDIDTSKRTYDLIRRFLHRNPVLGRLDSTLLDLDRHHVAGGIGLTGEHPTVVSLALR
jgi:hypothetical protein